MMNDRYQNMFSHLAQNIEGAFIPFVMLGDPTIKESETIIDTLIANGADALELGIPFSDPVADGPVIQRADYRALVAGVTPELCLDLIMRLRAKYPDIPIGLLVYANLIVYRGLKEFYEHAARVGVDSVLIADVPLSESASFIAAANNAAIAPVLIVPPNADDDLLRDVARLSQGYVYCLGRAGVTGADRMMEMTQTTKLTTLRELNAAPTVIGFGISTPEHVRMALNAGARGAIAGSAIVALIERHHKNPDALHTALASFTRQMKAATRLSTI
ncbi:MAG: tryptophan synthase subunit alpha [Burkholderiales bacterium]|jgi:tryptophan synthase alpha chain|nr:tryptophan synthase subunit alpha [Burkholderiales bacterium]